MKEIDKNIKHLLSEIKMCDRNIDAKYSDSAWEIMKDIYERELQKVLMKDDKKE